MANIVIIEDDPFVRNYYDRLFRLGSHHQVIIASNGPDGIEVIKSVKPQLVLLDIMMPGMNGLEVLAKLKSDDETRNICVVMLTNFGEEDTIKKAGDLGASGVILKSEVEGDELLARVDTLVEDQPQQSAGL